jgi:hypothetical protein
MRLKIYWKWLGGNLMSHSQKFTIKEKIGCGTVVLVIAGFFTLLVILAITQEIKESKKRDELINQCLAGSHKLRKIYTEKKVSSRESLGGFFAFGFGGINGNSSTKEIDTVKFAWNIRNNEYVLSSVPLEKIRVCLNNNIETPYITFSYYENYFNYSKPLKNVVLIYIHCHPDQWKIDIKIPMEENNENI